MYPPPGATPPSATHATRGSGSSRSSLNTDDIQQGQERDARVPFTASTRGGSLEGTPLSDPAFDSSSDPGSEHTVRHTSSEDTHQNHSAGRSRSPRPPTQAGGNWELVISQFRDDAARELVGELARLMLSESTVVNIPTARARAQSSERTARQTRTPRPSTPPATPPATPVTRVDNIDIRLGPRGVDITWERYHEPAQQEVAQGSAEESAARAGTQRAARYGSESASRPTLESAARPTRQIAAPSSPPHQPRSVTQAPAHQSASPSRSPPPDPRHAAQAVQPSYPRSSVPPTRHSVAPNGPPLTPRPPAQVVPKYIHSSSNPPAFTRGPDSESTFHASSESTYHTAWSGSDDTTRPMHNGRGLHGRAPSPHPSVESNRGPPVPPKEVYNSAHPPASARHVPDSDGRIVPHAHDVAGPSRHPHSLPYAEAPGPSNSHNAPPPAVFTHSDTSSDDIFYPDSDVSVRPPAPPARLQSFDGHTRRRKYAAVDKPAPPAPPRITFQPPTASPPALERQEPPVENGTDVSLAVSTSYSSGYTGAEPEGSYVHSSHVGSGTDSRAMVPAAPTATVPRAMVPAAQKATVPRATGASANSLAPPPRNDHRKPTALTRRDPRVGNGTDVSDPVSTSYSSGYTGAGPEGSYVHSSHVDSGEDSRALVPAAPNTNQALVPRPAVSNSGYRVTSFVGSWVESLNTGTTAGTKVGTKVGTLATSRPAPHQHVPLPHPLRERYSFMPYDYFAAAASGKLPPWLLYVVFSRPWRAPPVSAVPHDPGAHLAGVLPSFEIFAVAWMQLSSLCWGGDATLVGAMANHLQWLGILAQAFTWPSVCAFHCRMTAPMFQRGLHGRSWEGLDYRHPDFTCVLVRIPEDVVNPYTAIGKDKVCMLWNFNSCPIFGPPGPCRAGRKHVCMTCSGDHKAQECPEGWKAAKLCGGEDEPVQGDMNAPRGCYWWNHGRCAEPCGWGMSHVCTICTGTHKATQCVHQKKKTRKY